MSLCHDLADRIVNHKIYNSDHKIIDASNSAILDTIGVTLIGSKSEATRSILKPRRCIWKFRLVGEMIQFSSFRL